MSVETSESVSALMVNVYPPVMWNILVDFLDYRIQAVQTEVVR